jgi:hypothetical protein
LTAPVRAPRSASEQLLDRLELDTAITLPVGVEAYAAYALRAWLASEHMVSARTRRFAKWSAICSWRSGRLLRLTRRTG